MVDATRKARKADYLKLVAAASEVVINSRRGSLYDQSRSGENEYVLVEFPYFVKFQSGFPKGQIIEKTKTSNVHRINAVRLLDWLHEQGYSKHSATQLVQRTKGYDSLYRSIERMFE
jgi:hypothetical protein